MHLSTTTSDFVFSSPQGHLLRRSDFHRPYLPTRRRRHPQKGTLAILPGLTFHGLRHSHKTWLIADGTPEIAQAAGSATTYPTGWSRPTATSPPKSNTVSSADSNSAGNAPTSAPDHPTTARSPRAMHTTTNPARRTSGHHTTKPRQHPTTPVRSPRQRAIRRMNSLLNSSICAHPGDHRQHPKPITGHVVEDPHQAKHAMATK
jgi:hypothetical protein